MVGMWTPDYHTPKEFNLKDAFKLIQAKAQSNTTVWGRLGPAKQRDIVKYIHCSTTVRPVGWRELWDGFPGRTSQDCATS
ncbi:hypothetical protein MVLG_06548 [Microbotryum lychnidis-dioicae p1A1 Lamole]|uniref:Uncharacterized protein n=1 Tax=Microbotryum lychnidis-dioicae (strain p1A1 Lamole / MvSl-1064) TaxID=683840 RepID=U5HHL9_USTV1|nr:hypothetical protein MVLG_06548 [Microbotryum lychnidis-dioicae p1A1 Lamole]|eukprot:KDE02921.1 hypothetical protein MVLG_06548 [Microbotryum lychnidis-dioicae p1A1 Lamole]